jgi:hypothetical protein
MHIINETIMTESGEQIQIISHDLLNDSDQITAHAIGQSGQVLDQDGQVISGVSILTESEQILSHIGQIVCRKKHEADQERCEDVSHQFDQPDSLCQNILSAKKDNADDHAEQQSKAYQL